MRCIHQGNGGCVCPLAKNHLFYQKTSSQNGNNCVKLSNLQRAFVALSIPIKKKKKTTKSRNVASVRLKETFTEANAAIWAQSVAKSVSEKRKQACWLHWNLLKETQNQGVVSQQGPSCTSNGVSLAKKPK